MRRLDCEQLSERPAWKRYGSPMVATIAELRIADDPQSWATLGFDVVEDSCTIGTVVLRFLGSEAGRGIVGWSLRGIVDTELDGLPTTHASGVPSQDVGVHANGVRSIDHVVAISPELSRSVTAL